MYAGPTSVTVNVVVVKIRYCTVLYKNTAVRKAIYQINKPSQFFTVADVDSG